MWPAFGVDPKIEARDITLTYQTPSGAVAAVHGVSFGIETSEFLCIVGPSGCGKSTLLNILAGFLTPTRGEMRLVSLHPGVTLEAVCAEVGWPLAVAELLVSTPPPTDSELEHIRTGLDPQGLYRA